MEILGGREKQEVAHVSFPPRSCFVPRGQERGEETDDVGEGGGCEIDKDDGASSQVLGSKFGVTAAVKQEGGQIFMVRLIIALPYHRSECGF